MYERRLSRLFYLSAWSRKTSSAEVHRDENEKDSFRRRHDHAGDSVASAFAADLPCMKVPPAPYTPPPPTWTGFYLGLEAGIVPFQGFDEALGPGAVLRAADRRKEQREAQSASRICGVFRDAGAAFV